jgi:hypothetical protein
MEADQMETQARHQRSHALHELQRLHDHMGGAVFLYGLFSCSTTWPARLRLSHSLVMVAG